MEKENYVAAIDLGSNSFHMVIADAGDHGSIKIMDQVREMIRLNAGLDPDRNLSGEAQQRALECLHRFRQCLTGIPVHRIRAVGTNTLRNAQNSDAFLKCAEAALGHPISVVSGHEEARLVYLGAAFDLSTRGKKRLVVDIGGGSTELIVGKSHKPLHMDSLEIGCVSLTRNVFDDGCITKSQFKRAKNLVSMELQPVIGAYRKLKWQEAVGTSGTIKAVDNVARELGVEQDWVSAKSMAKVKKWILDAKYSHSLSHVSDQRRPVFAAGFVILSTIFEELGINRMDISQGALREGVAYDLIGRLHDEDSRFHGVASLVTQFKTDPEQANRVQNLAIRFLDQVKDDWDLQENLNYKLLYWSARLHEVGISVSYDQYHLHSAYIIEHSNMDGFSRQIQKVLALLVRCHRLKIEIDAIARLPDEWVERVTRLIILLRLAVAFYRSRSDVDLFGILIKVSNRQVIVSFPKGWGRAHPLTVFDLENEKLVFESMGYGLEVGSNGTARFQKS